MAVIEMCLIRHVLKCRLMVLESEINIPRVIFLYNQMELIEFARFSIGISH